MKKKTHIYSLITEQK